MSAGIGPRQTARGQRGPRRWPRKPGGGGRGGAGGTQRWSSSSPWCLSLSFLSTALSMVMSRSVEGGLRKRDTRRRPREERENVQADGSASASKRRSVYIGETNDGGHSFGHGFSLRLVVPRPPWSLSLVLASRSPAPKGLNIADFCLRCQLDNRKTCIHAMIDHPILILLS